MPQFVGQPCSYCGQPICSILAGSFCEGCGKPIHHACRVPDEEPDTFWHCSRCGGAPSAVPQFPEEYRLTETPREVNDSSPAFQVPDVRQRRPLWKKVLIGLFLIVLAIGAIRAYRWSGQNEIERVLQQSFEEKTGRSVSAVHLKHTGDGNYVGTVTIASGDEWDVKAKVTGGGSNRRISWQARGPLAQAERDLRLDMETKLNKKVRSVKMVRLDDGRFSGTAELESGEQFDISESDDPSSPYLLLYEWNQATIEKWIRQGAQERHNDTLRTLSITRQGPLNYTGKASGTSGLEYRISITSPKANGKEAADGELHLEALPSSFPAWMTKELEKALKVKVEKAKLERHADGYCTGQAFCDSGETYEVRVGTPLAWRKDARADLPTWAAVSSPTGAQVWLKKQIEEDRKVTIKSLKMGPLKDGSQTGTALLDDGKRLRVHVERKKMPGKGEEEDLWPDLPGEISGWEASELD